VTNYAIFFVYLHKTKAIVVTLNIHEFFRFSLMPTIYIPITKSNANFLKVYHPKPICFGLKDSLGLILSTVIKITYDKKKTERKKIDRLIYPEDLSLNYGTIRHFNRNGSICLNAVKVANLKIERIAREQLDLYIITEKDKNPTVEYRTLIYRFQAIYGLPDDNKTIAAIERRNRRIRLLQKQL
jgi:hypothetical protein